MKPPPPKPPKLAARLTPAQAMKGTGEARQSTAAIGPRRHRARRDGKLVAARAAKFETFAELIGPGLEPGDSLHLLSRGHFDTVTIPAWFAHHCGGLKRFTASSLTISRGSVLALAELDEAGLLDEARIIVQDLTMSRSEHRAHIEAVRAWMQHSRHTLRIVESHAKVFVMEPHDGPIVVMESSANLSSNDNRLEQYALHADAELAAWHLEWFEEIFNHSDEKLPRSWFPSPSASRVVREGNREP